MKHQFTWLFLSDTLPQATGAHPRVAVEAVKAAPHSPEPNLVGAPGYWSSLKAVICCGDTSASSAIAAGPCSQQGWETVPHLTPQWALNSHDSTMTGGCTQPPWRYPWSTWLWWPGDTLLLSSTGHLQQATLSVLQHNLQQPSYGSNLTVHW